MNLDCLKLKFVFHPILLLYLKSTKKSICFVFLGILYNLVVFCLKSYLIFFCNMENHGKKAGLHKPRSILNFVENSLHVGEGNVRSVLTLFHSLVFKVDISVEG